MSDATTVNMVFCEPVNGSLVRALETGQGSSQSEVPIPSRDKAPSFPALLAGYLEGTLRYRGSVLCSATAMCRSFLVSRYSCF